MFGHRCGLFLAVVMFAPPLVAQEPQSSGDTLTLQSRQALIKAVRFFHEQVAVEGGYVYQISADLQWREGEGVAAPQTVWVQPPGTPSVGLALLEAYQRTGEEEFLKASQDAAHCLVRGQLHSGGWQDHIDFGDDLRGKLAYRVDGPKQKKARNISSLDDDKTQSALRFLMQYDRQTKFSDNAVHESVQFALDKLLANQYPNGGFAQVFETPPDGDLTKYPIVHASFPETWPLQYPGGEYWWFYTINDNNISRLIDTMFLAHEVYGETRYRESAIKAADFLLLAQLPEPQPAWAQQYNFQMQPVWARKFEPPAVSGGESQEVIDTLMDVYEKTGDLKYLDCLPRALEYLKSCRLEDGRLPRFNAMKSNKPLYMNTQYQLTDSSDDLPKHYGFIVRSQIETLERRWKKLHVASENSNNAIQNTGDLAFPNKQQVEKVIGDLDRRGAWVEPGKLTYHRNNSATEVIRSDTFIRNIGILSRYLQQR